MLKMDNFNSNFYLNFKYIYNTKHIFILRYILAIDSGISAERKVNARRIKKYIMR